MAAEYKPTIISSDKEITIKFKKAPIEGTMVVEQWVDESNVQSIEVKNDTIKIPQEIGIYTYHIMANWEKGSGSYAFSIEVR